MSIEVEIPFLTFKNPIARAVISDAAGPTVDFLHQIGIPREESANDHRLVISARVQSGEFAGERAITTFLGNFDYEDGKSAVDEIRQSVDGDLHFRVTFEQPVSLQAFFNGRVDPLLTYIGNRYANALGGDRHDDDIRGRGGADKLVGLGGADTLTGGSGADHFVYRQVSDSKAGHRDVILDFGNGSDLIDLESIDSDEDAAGNQAFDFIGRAGFSGVAGELRVGRHGDDALVLGDTDGDGNADLSIRLEDASSIGADAFLL